MAGRGKMLGFNLHLLAMGLILLLRELEGAVETEAVARERELAE